MKLSKSVNQRLKALKLNLIEVDNCYSLIQRDYYEDVGIKYDVWYPEIPETEALFKKGEDLYEDRKDKLFTAILNFNQTFSTFKDYLKEQDPLKEVLVDEFFTSPNNHSNSRNKIANDLKHRPKNDLNFDSKIVKTETIKEVDKVTFVSFMKLGWFSKNTETVEHCHELYNDLILFLDKNFSSVY